MPFLADPEQFIRDLSRVCPTIPPSFEIGGFLDDLGQVHRGIVAEAGPGPVVAEHDLTELAALFAGIKDGAIKKLGGSNWLEKLPANDPLRCRVGLFGTFDLGLHETAHTRALAWLMDPDGDHGFGASLLRAFLKQVFGLDGEPQLSDVSIRSELRGDMSRDRFDIYMRGNWTIPPDDRVETWLVIVEAKIEADEGEDQCARYEDHSHGEIVSRDKHALVFLTLDGRPPTTGSKGGGGEWIRLSFIKLMALFRQQLGELNGEPGAEFLPLYMTGVLRDLYQLNCGNITGVDDIYHISEYLSSAITGGISNG